MPRRVLIIVENLPVPFDTRVWNESSALAAAGYAVTVICPTGDGCSERFAVIDGVHIYRHPLTPAAHGILAYLREYAMATCWQTYLTWRVYFGRGFDVLHACNPPDTLFVLGLVFKLLGKRFVFDHHDPGPELYELKFARRGPAYRILRWLERRSYRTADLVIETSESMRQIAIDRGDVDPARIRVVRSGPGANRLQTVPPNPRWRCGRTYLVGYVGLMGDQDGIHRLLEAARHIVHDMGRRDVQFTILGYGPALEGLRALSRTFDIADYVLLPGKVESADVVEMLATADVCVTPDEVNAMNDKITMIKTMEYMAAGKPIVQFATTEGRLVAGDASLYATPNDSQDLAEKIVALLDDPARRLTMGECGVARVRAEFAWSHQAAKLVAAYETCVIGPAVDGRSRPARA